MQVIQTKIPDLLIIEPDVFSDERGYFFESYSQQKYSKFGIESVFIQDNVSSSTYGVVRGLHYQLEPHSQAKLIQVLKGKVLDVAVDLRKGSPTYGQSLSIVISEENRRQFFVPQGFAHGFSVLSNEVLFSYKCDNYYNKEAERGISFNDQTLGIDWHLPENEMIVSAKDLILPSLEEADHNFVYKN
jgi:dTDP-4-dehydrorhamnose 3,5-epimerase